MVVDGFFPLNEAQERAGAARAGIVEFGLPYASDAAITRHLASFLRQHAAASREALGLEGDAIPVPDTLLLNGGVFRGAALARRLVDTLAGWRGAPLTHAAQRESRRRRRPWRRRLRAGAPGPGAAHRRRLGAQLFPAAGRRSARRPAARRLPAATRHAGRHEVRLANRSFALRLGRPVRFHLVSTIADAGAAPQAGELVDLQLADVVRLPPIATRAARLRVRHNAPRSPCSWSRR